MRPINVREILASGATICEWRFTLPIKVSHATTVHIGGAAMETLRLGITKCGVVSTRIILWGRVIQRRQGHSEGRLQYGYYVSDDREVYAQ